MQLLREVNLGGGAGFWEDIVHNVLSTSFLLDSSSIKITRPVDTKPPILHIDEGTNVIKA